MAHSMNVTEHAQLQIQERNVWALANPASIQVYKEYPPGFTQYGCCACMPAPTWWPGLSCFPCVLPPTELRNTMAASKFIRITEQGLMWNFAYFGMRDQCLGVIPCNLCCWKVLDDVTYLPWDDPAMDQIKIARRCAMFDCCTIYGFCCGPYTCGTKFTKTCCPCCDVWPFKVCYIEGCDERMQYCNGGYGTNIKFRQTFCGGLCVRAYPGLCCCLCPTALSGVGKFCCAIPHAFDVYVRPEEAQDFVATMNQFKQERLKVIKVQPR